jgi:RNA polymerase sigma factor (sigma-70 family)
VNSAARAGEGRQRLVPLGGTRGPDDSNADANDAVSREPDPETLILRAETHDELWQALDRLPPAQRAAAVLRLYLELPEAETAAQLGIPTGTVKSRVNAARTRLRLVLGRPPDHRDTPIVVPVATLPAETVTAEQEAPR